MAQLCECVVCDPCNSLEHESCQSRGSTAATSIVQWEMLLRLHLSLTSAALLDLGFLTPPQVGPHSPPHGMPYGPDSANASPIRGLGLTPHPAKIGHVRFNMPYTENGYGELGPALWACLLRVEVIVL